MNEKSMKNYGTQIAKKEKNRIYDKKRKTTKKEAKKIFDSIPEEEVDYSGRKANIKSLSEYTKEKEEELREYMKSIGLSIDVDYTGKRLGLTPDQKKES